MITATTENEGYARFRQAMNDGIIQPGMVVTQSELCTMLNLSLTPLRETLVLLEQFGLVEIKPRAGIRIVYPEVAFIRENYQFRAVIETYAVRQFASVVKANWIATMREKHAEARKLLETEDNYEPGSRHLLALDLEFHQAMVASLENQAVLDTHQRLQENLGMARRVHRRAVFRAQLFDTLNEHDAIIDRLAEHDADAAVLALEQHFRGSTHRTYAN